MKQFPQSIILRGTIQVCVIPKPAVGQDSQQNALQNSKPIFLILFCHSGLQINQPLQLIESRQTSGHGQRPRQHGDDAKKTRQNNARQRKTPSDTAEARAQNSEIFITFNLF